MRDYERAVELRSGGFKDQVGLVRTLVGAAPRVLKAGDPPLRIGVVTVGAPAPGMNTAVRAAVRLAIDRGHEVLAVHNGFDGLIDGQVEPFGWTSVHGWGSFGGSKLGTSRRVPEGRELYAMARTMEDIGIQALLVIGGWSAYRGGPHAVHRAADLPGLQRSDRLRPGVDRQQPARIRAEHRR